MRNRLSSLLYRILLGIAVLITVIQSDRSSWGQVIGDVAELDRLRAKAEESIGNDDPDGAALNMGRAALMAKQLSKKFRDDAAKSQLYQAAEPLFRSQEHGYRAMALFRRAGDQLPASSGVCGSLSLAQTSVQQALSLLEPMSDNASPLVEPVKQLHATADDWVIVLASMITDYQCP
ncbi:conserved exported protein of unknown function [Nitrospira sp. KM1]|uniref:hypothetical protein n=1 Tax=Nitrospira sp. KM1 TaxID=1936990 RepID=UPI0013A77CE2|nr:hypothetical protein [Nitrospira sp. KM1]BCA53977.1 conserved exported protein of unknown function [Nitrospira sp. KM1]